MRRVTAQEIVTTARRYLGAPYQHLARGPVAYDCLGLLLTVARVLEQVAPDFDFLDYTADPSGYLLTRHLPEHLVTLPTWEEMQPGDVLLQKFRANVPASHVILITDQHDGHWWGIHASNRPHLLRVVEQRLTHLERNLTAYRMPGLVGV